MELLKRELTFMRQQSIIQAEESQKQRNFIFGLIFLTNVLIVMGENSELNLQIILLPDSHDPLYALASIYGAVLIFIIGQIIDIRNCKTIFILLLCYQLIYKLLTCEDLILSAENINTYLSPFCYTGELTLNFIYYVTFFNWYSRKQLFLVNGLFYLSKFIGNCCQFIYQIRDESPLDPDDERLLIVDPAAYKTTVVISSILLGLLIVVHWKFFWIEPLDVGIVCNEQAVIIHAQFPDMDMHSDRKIRTLSKMREGAGSLFWKRSRNFLQSLSKKHNSKSQFEVEEMIINIQQQETERRPSLGRFSQSLDDQKIIENDEDNDSHDQERTYLFNRYIKQNTSLGISIYEVMMQPGVLRILLASALITFRNVFGFLLIQMNEHRHLFDQDQLDRLYIEVFFFRLLMILILIVIGYICMTRMRGRKILFFYILVASAMAMDLACIICNFTLRGLDNFDFILLIQMKIQYILTQGLMFFTTCIMPVDVGKIDLLKNKRKIFGQVFSSILAILYVLSSFVLINVDKIADGIGEKPAEHTFLIIQFILTIPLILIFQSQYKVERGEVTHLTMGEPDFEQNLHECMF